MGHSRPGPAGGRSSHGQFGAIRTEPGNPRLRRTTWWGREDSNFVSLKFNRPFAETKRSHRLCRWWSPCEETEFLRQRRRGRNGQRQGAKTARKIQSTACRDRLCSSQRPIIAQEGRATGGTILPVSRQPRYFGHFASHEIPTGGPVAQYPELAADNRLVASSSPPSPRWRLITAWLEV